MSEPAHETRAGSMEELRKIVYARAEHVRAEHVKHVTAKHERA